MGSWADNAIKALTAGHSITINPKGNSMLPLIKSGEVVKLEPITDSITLGIGDIVLVRVKGKVYLHLIKATRENEFLIGNNRGRINGWTGKKNIYGKAKL